MIPLSSLIPTRTLSARAALPSTEAEIAAVFEPMGKAPLAFMFCQVPIDTFFAGVLTMQVYSYFKYQKNDNWWIKSVVISSAFINAGFTIYLWVFMQYLFVENFGLWSPFAETNWLAGGPFVDSINSGIIQAFFAYRAYRLCNRMWIIPLVCGILIITSIAATMAVLIMFSGFTSLFQAEQVAVPELIWLSSIMAADIIITLSIIYGLLKSKTGWSHTDRVIVRLIRMTLESQLPPTAVALTFLIEFVRTPSSLFGATMQGIQPKFYAMGLMYALNARVTFQQKWVGHNDRTGPVFAMSNRPTQKTQLQTALEVEVETQTYVQSSAKNEYDRAFDQVGVNRQGVYDIDEDKKDAESFNDSPQVRFNSQARLTDPQNQ